MRRDTLLLRRGTILFVAPENCISNSRIYLFAGNAAPFPLGCPRSFIPLPQLRVAEHRSSGGKAVSSGDKKSIRIRKFTFSSSPSSSFPSLFDEHSFLTIECLARASLLFLITRRISWRTSWSTVELYPFAFILHPNVAPPPTEIACF